MYSMCSPSSGGLPSVRWDRLQCHVTLNKNKQIERMDVWLDISLNTLGAKLCILVSVLYVYSVFAVCVQYVTIVSLCCISTEAQGKLLFFCVLRLRQGLCPSKGPRPLTPSSPHRAVYKPLSSQTVLLLSVPFIWCKHLPRLRPLEPLRPWMSKMPW